MYVHYYIIRHDGKIKILHSDVITTFLPCEVIGTLSLPDALSRDILVRLSELFDSF